MNRLRISFISILIIIPVILMPYRTVTAASNNQEFSMNESKISKIEDYVQKCMDKGDIPGLAITIVTKDKIFTKCYGYSDMVFGIAVDEDTKFELASNSKAFTALAVLRLQAEGKLSLEDSVYKYIPEITLYYHSQKADITLEQLLHHTSGVPYSTVGDIPEDLVS